jgi:hypothetical protein
MTINRIKTILMKVHDNDNNDDAGCRIDVDSDDDHASCSCRIDGIEVCNLKALLDDQYRC